MNRNIPSISKPKPSPVSKPKPKKHHRFLTTKIGSFMLALVIGDTTLSGKIGNRVYMKNGRVRRLHVTASDTPSQEAVRNTFANLSALWDALTDGERLAWDEAAATGLWNHPNRVGNIVQPSGIQLFKSLNGNLTLTGADALLTSPDFDPVEGFNAFEADYTLGGGENLEIITADTDRELQLTDVMVIEATGKLSAGKRRIGRSLYRTIATATTVEPIGEDVQFTLPIDLTSSYNAVFGSGSIGAHIHLRICIQSAQGQRSSWIYTTATLAA